MSCLNASTFVLSRKSLSLYQSRSKLILSAQFNQSVFLFVRSLPPFQWNYCKTVFEDKSSSSNHKFGQSNISFRRPKDFLHRIRYECFEPEGWSRNPRDPRWLVHHPNSSSIPEKPGVICFQISSMFGELVWKHYRYTPAWHDNWHYVGTIHVFRFLGRVRVSMDASFIQMRSISA